MKTGKTADAMKKMGTTGKMSMLKRYQAKKNAAAGLPKC